MTSGDVITLTMGGGSVFLAAAGLWFSMRADARNRQASTEEALRGEVNRMQARIWQLEDELRRGHDE